MESSQTNEIAHEQGDILQHYLQSQRWKISQGSILRGLAGQIMANLHSVVVWTCKRDLGSSIYIIVKLLSGCIAN